MLSAMLNDPELENRRLALITLNSATQNKGALILPHLSQLLPLVIKESNINPALIREVQMGPFKHKVDDGLEIRKVRGLFGDVVQAVLIDSLRVPTKRYMP